MTQSKPSLLREFFRYASLNMLGMVGVGADETIDTPWLRSVSMRLPWLLVNMMTSALSAFVVYLFEGSIASMAVLAVLSLRQEVCSSKDRIRILVDCDHDL